MSRRTPQLQAPRYERHPIYGKIPLIAQNIFDGHGRSHTVFLYDPDFEPDLPRGAVRGNIRKQNLCFAHNVPMYFYVDEQRTCVQCGDAFVFRAAEQKFWYESLGFYGTSVAVRCPPCRRKQRSEKVLRAQIAAAKTATASDPTDAAAWSALAEAIVRYHERTGQGDLNQAIAASRRARKLWPDAKEPPLWEALAQLRSNRPDRARPLLDLFLSRPVRTKRCRDLLQRAREAYAMTTECPGTV